MAGVIVNTLTVLIGSLVGILFKKGIPERVSKALMIGIGLCTVYIGITGSLKGKNTLVLILSIIIGAIIGTLIDLDRHLTGLGSYVEKKFSRSEGTSIAEGFVTASLVFCVGSMTIVGSLQSGLSGNNEMIYTKSLLDLISSAVFASTLGVGVLLSSVFVFIFQGALVLLAGFIAPYLGEAVIAEMTCAGSLLIIALGLNIMGISKFKVANYLPAIFIPIALCPLYNLAADFIAVHF